MNTHQVLPLRIGIDARLYSKTGVGRYIRSLMYALSEADHTNRYFIYLNKSDYDTYKIPNSNWKKRRVDIAWHSITEQIYFPRIISHDHPDVMHFPYFSLPCLYQRPFVITIHDLIVDHFETGQASTLPIWKYKLKRLGYQWILKTALKRCRSIITISNTTKQEIMNHYHIPESKITVTYDALDKSFQYAFDHRKNTVKNGLPANYLLYVGNAYPHKNLEAFLDALKLINKQMEMHAVLAGDDHFFYPRLMEYAKKIGIDSRIIFWGDANDSTLIILYSNARLLILPSLMEGYGLPVVEAVYCGLMPVVSDIPVFHELWGDKINYFNPNDSAQMARIILQNISMPKSEYHIRIGKLKKAIFRYQWDQTAKQTLQIYQNSASISGK